MHGMVTPDYSIKRFTDSMYKVIKYKYGATSGYKDDFYFMKNKVEEATVDLKLANNISRAKSAITEIAFCNDWDWFITLTISPEKFDRYNLKLYIKSLSQFIRNISKKYDSKIQYMLVPELHKDGAWHMHGYINGLPDDVISGFVKGVHPDELVVNGYKNWIDYENKFGFCSLGKIKDKAAATSYLISYIKKSMESRITELGAHLYYASQKLNRATTVNELYGCYPELDAYIKSHGKYVSVGFVYGEDWTFPIRFDDDSENEYKYVPNLLGNEAVDLNRIMENKKMFHKNHFDVPMEKSFKVLMNYKTNEYLSHNGSCFDYSKKFTDAWMIDDTIPPHAVLSLIKMLQKAPAVKINDLVLLNIDTMAEMVDDKYESEGCLLND